MSADASAAAERPGILLTGATGFFGSFLLDTLLEMTEGTVYCLVRATDDRHARTRVRQNLLRYHRWRPEVADRLAAIAGDLAQPRLGLDSTKYERIASQVTTIYHNGAIVNHMLPLSHLAAANVDGTRALTQLAAHGMSKKLVHMSANAVIDGYATGYVESKRQAENVIRDAVADGVCGSVYRLPRLAPDSRGGQPNENDAMIRLVEIILAVGTAPETRIAEDWVSADVAARAIVAAGARAACGDVYTLVADEPVVLPYLLAAATDAGFDIPVEPLPDWVARVKALRSTEYDVTLGLLGLDGTDVADPDSGAPVDGADRGTPLVAERITRAALTRYFARCRAGFDGARQPYSPFIGTPQS
ncbi:MAG TPA: thioester reductase domain-containing protein [Pseudonocardiaceae bacterium]|nr:thioester reductase domain-containing protein [Pseudonocardiaceae bacterium]